MSEHLVQYVNRAGGSLSPRLPPMHTESTEPLVLWGGEEHWKGCWGRRQRQDEDHLLINFHLPVWYQGPLFHPPSGPGGWHKYISRERH